MGLLVAENRIAEAERELGMAFPVDLRQRLLSNNGGDIFADGVSWVLYPVWDPTTRKSATRSANHIVRETRMARSWPGFPEDAVAIASDGSGDQLILRPGRPIELWFHDTGDIEEVVVKFYPELRSQ